MDGNGKITKKVRAETTFHGLFGLEIGRMPLSDGSEQVFLGEELELSAADRQRLSDIQNVGRKRHFIAARHALNAIDPKLLAALDYDDRRPKLPQGHVSLSHGGKHAFAIFHPSLAVGIDVEGPRDQLARIAKKFLHPEELAFTATQENHWALRVAWGAKEAIFKAAHQPGLDFSEGIRLLSWPKMLNASSGVQGNLGSFEAQIRDGRRFRLGAEMLETTDGSFDCLVWAVEIPRSLEIVLTGAESSGKSTLGERIHATYGWTLVPEYARTYFSMNTSEGYGIQAIQSIHAGQRHRIQEAHERLSAPSAGLLPRVICDTDELTTQLWAEEKFGTLPEDMATSPRAHAYLVCSEEIPWEADPLRENPHDRSRLTNVILEKIQTLKRPYILLRGSIEERETQAIDFIQRQGF